MTNRGAARIGFQLLAAWFTASGLIAAASLVYLIEPEYEGFRRTTLAVSLLPILVTLGIALYLWSGADRLAGHTVQGAAEGEVGPLGVPTEAMAHGSPVRSMVPPVCRGRAHHRL